MGWFDGVSDAGRSSRHSSSGHHKKHHTSSSSHHHSGGSPKSAHSRDRSRSRTRSIFGDSKHNSSKSSFFGMFLHISPHASRALFRMRRILLRDNVLTIILQASIPDQPLTTSGHPAPASSSACTRNCKNSWPTSSTT
jgi:hypothetical protein